MRASLVMRLLLISKEEKNYAMEWEFSQAVI